MNSQTRLFSVFMGNGEPGNETICSWPIIILDFLFMSIQVLVVSVTNEQPQLLSFKLDTQTILEMYYLLHWHTDHLLNCLLRSISPYMLHSQSTYQTKVLLCQPTCIHTLQAQVGEKREYKAIKHFSNSFLYRLPAHTNVESDAPLRQSHICGATWQARFKWLALRVYKSFGKENIFTFVNSLNVWFIHQFNTRVLACRCTVIQLVSALYIRVVVFGDIPTVRRNKAP